MVAVLLLLALEFMCLGLLALLRFRAAGSVLIDLQLQRLLVVLGVALTYPDMAHCEWQLSGQCNPVGLSLQ